MKGGDETPITVFVIAIAAALLGYLLGEIALAVRPHRVHWAAALGGMLLGYLIGLPVQRRYGEICGKPSVFPISLPEAN